MRVHPELVQAEHTHAEHTHAEHTQTEQNQTEQNQAGHPHAGPARSGPGTAAPPDAVQVLERIAADLEVAAAARQAQLQALPPPTTPVAVAHRESVQRILQDIRAAQAEIADGTYGTCRRCGARADLTVALSRPWAPLCGSCAQH